MLISCDYGVAALATLAAKLEQVVDYRSLQIRPPCTDGLGLGKRDLPAARPDLRPFALCNRHLGCKPGVRQLQGFALAIEFSYEVVMCFHAFNILHLAIRVKH